MGELRKRCRLCYAKTADGGTDIFLNPSPENSFSKTIADCFQVYLKDSPNCPKKCCDKCMELLFELKVFRGKITLTQDTLRSLLPESDDENIEFDSESAPQQIVKDRKKVIRPHKPPKDIGNPSIALPDPSSEDIGAEDNGGNNSANDIRVTTKSHYRIAYDQLMMWKKENGYTGLTDLNVITKYFVYLANEQRRNPANLPSLYSGIRHQIISNENVDPGTYSQMKKDIDDQVVDGDFNNRTASTFSMDQVVRFLTTAPDEKYLLDKIILIVSIWGALKLADVLDLRPTDVKIKENRILVYVQGSNRTVTIRSIPEVDLIQILQTYVDIVKDCPFRTKFLHQLRNLRPRKLSLGRQAIKASFKTAAEWMGLPNIHSYTSYSGYKTAQERIKNTW